MPVYYCALLKCLLIIISDLVQLCSLVIFGICCHL